MSSGAKSRINETIYSNKRNSPPSRSCSKRRLIGLVSQGIVSDEGQDTLNSEIFSLVLLSDG